MWAYRQLTLAAARPLLLTHELHRMDVEVAGVEGRQLDLDLRAQERILDSKALARLVLRRRRSS